MSALPTTGAGGGLPAHITLEDESGNLRISCTECGDHSELAGFTRESFEQAATSTPQPFYVRCFQDLVAAFTQLHRDRCAPPPSADKEV